MGDKIIMIVEGALLETKTMKGAEVGHRQNRSNNRGDNRSISNSRSRSGSGASANRDRIRCSECRGCDHFPETAQ